jgi:AhpD family alkylhydroperoxidase
MSKAARRQKHMRGVMALDLAPAEPTPAMAAYFRKCEDKIGFVPNVLQAYSHDMAKLEAFAAFYNDLMLAPSGLSKLEREMIAVAVSAENRCYYCLAAHGAAVRSPRERAMLDFAVLLTTASAMVEEEDRQTLRDAGFSDRDIWDIAAVASFYNMSNRMASATDMRPNAEYHKQAR